MQTNHPLFVREQYEDKRLAMSAAILKYTSSGQRKEETLEIALITSQNYLKVKIIFGL